MLKISFSLFLFIPLLTFSGTGHTQPNPNSTSKNPTCKTPVKKQPVQKPKAGTPWLVQSDGVGNIPPDGLFPIQILDLEQKSFHDLYFGPIKNKDHYEAMMEGHFDQAGHRTIRLSKIDLTVVLSFNNLVMSLEPGPGLRTPEGTGVGSTLGQLLQAHGSYEMTSGYEDVCSVRVPQHPGVFFQYHSCEKACAGEGAYSVWIPGEHSWDESEMAPEALRSKNLQKLQMNQNELRFKQGVALMPKEEMAFSGTAIATDKNDKKVSEANYLHGQLHGDVTYFYPSGQKRLLFSYEKGKFKSGMQSWYPNGQKDLDSDFTKERCRRITKYYQDGQKEEEGIACYEQQTSKRWYKDGQLKSKEVRKEGEVIRKRWFKSGELKSKKVIQDDKETYKRWYKNGKLKKKEIREGGKVKRKCWSKKGKKKACPKKK
ncbi:MAG: hypothetical protein CMH56_07905 [Myxococcales bacterium]|nr:hypothetical protein [Myxococcales bacterium]|tara:strand:- start:822 stop:2105 length:1284 start_codon:yes stop_codon:yes gene_type:complete